MLHKKIIILSCICFIYFLCIGVEADAISTMETNLGASISDIVLIISGCGIFIIAAFNFRIGLMLSLVLFSSEFIIFYLATEQGYTGFDPTRAALAMMLSLVLLTLSIFATYKKTSTPGAI